ncbi:MAG: hypothetical protein IPN94_04190 [Sphingobacteriales bacterium]|nr:hypothetical protein [Sphingobacteriales bacterium]
MKNFLFIAAIVATIPLFAQTPKYYTKAFNWNGSKNSNGLSMGLNSNNNYIICGDTKDSTQRWEPFLQVNANGDFVRETVFPTVLSTYASPIGNNSTKYLQEDLQMIQHNQIHTPFK